MKGLLQKWMDNLPEQQLFQVERYGEEENREMVKEKR